jgi:hypothetical protein
VGVRLDVRKLFEHDPAPFVPGQYPAIGEKAHEIDHEKWIAFRAVMNSRGKLWRERMLRERETQVRVDVGARQKRNLDLAADAAPLQLELQVQKRMIRCQQVRRTVGGHNQKPKRAASRSDV